MAVGKNWSGFTSLAESPTPAHGPSGLLHRVAIPESVIPTIREGYPRDWPDVAVEGRQAGDCGVGLARTQCLHTNGFDGFAVCGFN